MKKPPKPAGAVFEAGTYLGGTSPEKAAPWAFKNAFERTGAARLHPANRDRPAERIGKAQIALIHVARGQTGVSEAHYREMLEVAEGVGSSKDLSPAGFEALMRLFRIEGFEPRSKPPAYGRRAGMATQAQIETVCGMWARWHGKHDEAALNHWIEGRFRVTSLRFASVRVAQMAIEGLKAMLARKEGQSSERQ